MPKAKKTSKDGLTIKQRKFLKFYLQSGNASDAARKAGYAHRERGLELVSKSIIQDAFQQLLDKQGITDEKLNKVLLDGLEADKVVGYLHQYKKKGKSGKVEKIQPDEIVSSEFVDVPDMPTRHKYMETAYKLKDKFKDKIELTGEGGEPLKLVLEVIEKRNAGNKRKDSTKAK